MTKPTGLCCTRSTRKGIGEALTGECIGQPLSRESTLILGADVVPVTEGNTDGRDNASAQAARRGLRHWHVRTLFAREPGYLMVCQRQHACCTAPCREGEETYPTMYDDEKSDPDRVPVR